MNPESPMQPPRPTNGQNTRARENGFQHGTAVYKGTSVELGSKGCALSSSTLGFIILTDQISVFQILDCVALLGGWMLWTWGRLILRAESAEGDSKSEPPGCPALSHLV